MEWLGGYCYEFCMNNDTLVFRKDCEVYSISFRLLDNEAFWSIWFPCRLRDLARMIASLCTYIIYVYFFTDNNVVLHLHCCDGQALWADVKLFLTVDCHFYFEFFFVFCCFICFVIVSNDCSSCSIFNNCEGYLMDINLPLESAQNILSIIVRVSMDY